MILRNINNNIIIVSKIANFFIKIGYAIILSQFLWWIYTPAYNKIYIDRVRINQHDDPTKYIVNRYPFGEITIIKSKDETPPFSTLVKLHGVYVNGNNSMAFIEFQNKQLAVEINHIIGNDITLKEVSADSIVISQNNVNATIKISKSNAVPNTNIIHRAPTYNGSNNNPAQNNKANNQELMRKRNELIKRFSHQEVTGNSPQNTNNGKANPNNDHR